MIPVRILFVPALSLLLAGSAAVAAEPAAITAGHLCAVSGPPHDHDGRLLPETILQLETARQAAAKYFDVEAATHAGYVDLHLFIPHMGWHFLNTDLLDGHFDPAKPELLVYQEDCDGNLRLAAVEYAIPTDLAAKAPRGFVGNADVWFKNDDFGLWTLHAWVYDHNPDGVFMPENMRLP